MADLLVVTGPPGAGKSTVAALVVAAFDSAALVPGDVFFSFWHRGIPPWLPQAHAQNTVAVRAAAATVGTFAAAGHPVVYDGVLGPWFLPTFARELRLHGAGAAADLHYAVLLPPLGTCRRRVADRVGHGFTDDDATVHMHADFARAEVEPRHVLLDPPGEPADVARLVLERHAAGDLRYRPAR